MPSGNFLNDGKARIIRMEKIKASDIFPAQASASAICGIEFIFALLPRGET
jgi:hypothetical protein